MRFERHDRRKERQDLITYLPANKGQTETTPSTATSEVSLITIDVMLSEAVVVADIAVYVVVDTVVQFGR
jgi:hypothetical protein